MKHPTSNTDYRPGIQLHEATTECAQGKLNTRAPIPQTIWFEEWRKTAVISLPHSHTFELASSETRGLPTRAYFGYPASRTGTSTIHNHSSSHPTKQRKNGERETSAATQLALKNMPCTNITSEKHELFSPPRHSLVWRHSASPSPSLWKPHSSPWNPPPWLCTAKHPFTSGTSKKGQIPLSVSKRQPKGGFAALCSSTVRPQCSPFARASLSSCSVWFSYRARAS